MALVISSQPNKALKFLVQKYIYLEPGPFRARSLDFLVQNVGPFTTPTCKPFGEQDRRARTYSKISDYKKGRLYPLLGRKWAITGMSTAQAE